MITQIRSKTIMCALIITKAVIYLFLLNPALAADNEEETYNISLVQTAEVDKEIVTVDDKKVLTEAHTVTKGDYIWNILRKKKLLGKSNLGEILSVLKKLNPSLTNIDLIHPGENIIIPLVVTPTGKGKTVFETDSEPIPLEDLKNLEYYTVRQGDSLVKVINDKYDVPRKTLYTDYLEQLKKLNPHIEDIDTIYPGQRVRLPIYSPKIIRAPIKKVQKTDSPTDIQEKKRLTEIGKELSELFGLLGEEWVQQGKHFIPLKTGGQIDLNTESYPMISLRNGIKVIVDLHDALPERMSDLIISNWDNYRIVHLKDRDTLNTALDKIFPECGYNKIYSREEGLVLEKDLKIEIMADWIIKLSPDLSPEKQNYVCINLINTESESLPPSLDSFLKELGIKMIDYPPDLVKGVISQKKAEQINTAGNRNIIIEKLLEIEGQTYSTGVDIPMYQGEGSDFNLVVKADYSFTRNKRDCVIDLKGLGTEIINLLNDHKFTVLQLSEEASIKGFATKTLSFLGLGYDDKDHLFHAFSGRGQNNISIIIPGVFFLDKNNLNNFISGITLPTEIIDFLSVKVDRLLYFDNPAQIEGN
ncbi:LysM peptidoglycan-binding domain-containing protein [Thermodesulfobacteriota bacterium]